MLVMTTIFPPLLRLQEWMGEALSVPQMALEQDRHVALAYEREEGRLRRFIRSRVPDERDVEDILQDVFFELMEAYRLMRPVEQVGAWLFRVARNRIADLFRRRRTEPQPPQSAWGEDGEALGLEDLLPSPAGGPDAAYARRLLIGEIEAALGELPAEQREVFVAHELEGRSFKDLAEETGVGVNTLLSRKRYAVLHLRRRLRGIHEEFMGRWEGEG